MKRGTTFAAAFYLGTVAWACVVVPPVLVLLVVAVTAEGRIFAGTCLAMGLLPWVGIKAAWTRRRRWRLACGIVGLGLVAGTFAVVWRMTRSLASPPKRVHPVFASHRESSLRFAVGKLVPEVDQLMFGATLLPWFDRRFTQQEAHALKTSSVSIYREMARDPEFAGIGGALPGAALDLLGARDHAGHAIVYVPPNLASSSTRPLIVFFHGGGGNFAAFTWVLSQLADRLQIIVVAPSNGFGRWHPGDAAEALVAAIDAADRVAPVDRQHIHLLGLSSGGRGVSEVIQRAPLRSFVLVSPVFERSRVGLTASAASLEQKRVLVLSGRHDARTPPEYEGENIAWLQSAGAEVTASFAADANHFLFFTHREWLLSELEKWLRSHGVE